MVSTIEYDQVQYSNSEHYLSAIKPTCSLLPAREVTHNLEHRPARMPASKICVNFMEQQLQPNHRPETMIARKNITTFYPGPN